MAMMMVDKIVVGKSSFPFLGRFMRLAAPMLPVKTQYDVKKFVTSAKSNKLYEYDEKNKMKEFTSGGYYWTTFLEGYLDFVRSGGVSFDNPHLSFVVNAIEEINFDPALARKFEDKEYTVNRIKSRFISFQNMLDGDSSSFFPIQIHKNEKSESASFIITTQGQKFFWASMDGYHRVFSAVMCGIEEIPFVFKEG
jgi:hypothetical protein